MASSARIDEIKKKFDENPRRYFAPLANEFRKAGDLEQAILICEEFLPQQAGHMSGHIVYGQALFESGRLPESRTVFETALGLDPENLIALRHLGDIARAQGDPVEARRWYDRVLEADPRNDEIQGLLAALDAEGAPAGASSGGSEAASELTPIELDMDDAAFAAPVAEPMGAPVTPSPAPAPDAPLESLPLDDLVPSSAAAAPAPTLARASAAPHMDFGRAEGLEPGEFEVPATAPARAEGLEPAEFEAPTGQSMRAEGLETTEFSAPAPDSTDRSLLDLEGSFTLAGSEPAGRVAPPAGLEESARAYPPAADEPGLPSLDLDEGLAVPEQAAAQSAAFTTPLADVPLGVAAGAGAEDPRMDPPAAMEAMPALSAEEPLSAASAAEPMLELPPSVIAAESVLMDAGQSLEDVDEDAAAADANSRPAPFVTETMAELYLSQGFHAQALGVFRQLSAASPADARLRERVAMLERGEYDDAPVAADGPNVREFLFRLATRRPGETASAASPPAADDFASFDAVPETPVQAAPPAAASTRHPWDLPSAAEGARTDGPVDDTPLPFMDTSEPAESAGSSEPAPVEPSPAAREPAAPSMPSPSERATTAQGGAGAASAGTIDALFGTRGTGTSEDSAASALAQAFGGAPDTPVITGRPARAATAELSLDSVFRDGPPRPPRPSQNFSFDQFFSESASDSAAGETAGGEGAAPGEPAERSADDVKQFNSWLQGLKPQ